LGGKSNIGSNKGPNNNNHNPKNNSKPTLNPTDLKKGKRKVSKVLGFSWDEFDNIEWRRSTRIIYERFIITEDYRNIEKSMFNKFLTIEDISLLQTKTIKMQRQLHKWGLDDSFFSLKR
jgi:hypothetical protein